jgi:hypothetical protein
MDIAEDEEVEFTLNGKEHRTVIEALSRMIDTPDVPGLLDRTEIEELIRALTAD